VSAVVMTMMISEAKMIGVSLVQTMLGLASMVISMVGVISSVGSTTMLRVCPKFLWWWCHPAS